MNWLRSKAKRLSLLALFALALQLGLSFGHTHNDVALASVAGLANASQASTPDADHDQDAHRDLCAICATIAMVNTGLAATAPSLPLPLTFASLYTAPSADTATPDSRRGAFQSRAPPQS